MNIRSNDATLNRPNGERFIDAPYVLTDLNAIIQQLQQEGTWQNSDRNAITIFKTEGTSIVVSALREGSIINDNVVEGLISIQVLKGLIQVQTELQDDPITIGPGELFSMHREFSHNLRASEDSFLLMTIAGT